MSSSGLTPPGPARERFGISWFSGSYTAWSNTSSGGSPTNRISVSQGTDPPPEWLRATGQGNDWTMYTSTDGTNWTQAGSSYGSACSLSEIALFTHDSSLSTGYAATFDRFVAV